MAPLPRSLVKPNPKLKEIRRIRALLDDPVLHTVCEAAKCPNIGECFARQTVTFMILGDRCTRNCAFCGVASGHPSPPDPEEPARLNRAVVKLGLRYVVITSVTRDDLPDGGAGHFAKVIAQCRMPNAECRIEVLIPDLRGDEKALRAILDAEPDVLNHNIETVPRLYPTVRPQADFRRSLDLLARAKALRAKVYTKSGFMVGLGERGDEVRAVLQELKGVGCDIVTIGQYLPPSRSHPEPARYVPPEEFAEYQRIGRELGLQKVAAGPFVRSSYRAAEALDNGI